MEGKIISFDGRKRFEEPHYERINTTTQRNTVERGVDFKSIESQVADLERKYIEDIKDVQMNAADFAKYCLTIEVSKLFALNLRKIYENLKT